MSQLDHDNSDLYPEFPEGEEFENPFKIYDYSETPFRLSTFKGIGESPEDELDLDTSLFVGSTYRTFEVLSQFLNNQEHESYVLLSLPVEVPGGSMNQGRITYKVDKSRSGLLISLHSVDVSSIFNRNSPKGIQIAQSLENLGQVLIRNMMKDFLSHSMDKSIFAYSNADYFGMTPQEKFDYEVRGIRKAFNYGRINSAWSQFLDTLK